MAELACPGFRFSGLFCGLKQSKKNDLALVVAEQEVPVAAAFTRNRVRAAPVILSERRARAGTARAILVNSGNANACTGAQGMEAARRMGASAAAALGCEDKQVLIASTGVIGRQLAVEKIERAMPELVAGLSPTGLDPFVQAIMTTDRFEKRATRTLKLGTKSCRLVGVAKGAGMIAPNMATTLAFVFTDANIGKGALRRALAQEIDRSFNEVSVDGDTSTNDSAFVMASGAAGNRLVESGPQAAAFGEALGEVLLELATLLVRDGEGATHVVTFEVKGAPSHAAAERVARRIGASPLVKSALFGADPNWGRIVCAVGNAGVPIRPDALDVSIGDVEVVRRGAAVGGDAEARAHEVMKRSDYRVRVHLHRGRGEGRHTTCDLTYDYVKLNADYST
jgi:glutamate N-acetyltransferase/amino-acid N-acetyltransferase